MKCARYAAALAVVPLLVAACSSGGGSTGSGGGATQGGGAVDGKGKSLNVWIMEGTNADATAFFTDVKTAFKNQTGADVNVQMVPWASAHDKFTTSIAGNTTPDVAEVGTTWTAEFGEAGALTDVSQDLAGAGGEGNLVPGLLEAAKVGKKVYGMPWYAGIRSFVYRTDMFDKAGVKPPTNWAELVAVAKKLKATNPDVVPFPIAGDASYLMVPFLWGTGGELATQSGGKWTCALTSDKAKQGLSFYTDLALKEGLSTPAATTWKETDVRDSFVKGQSAMILSGSWTPASIIQKNPDLKGKIGVFEVPGQTSGVAPSFVGGSVLSVFEQSKNPDLAWAFVKLMTTGDYATKWGTQTGFFPGTKDLLAKVQSGNDPLVTPFAKQFTDAGKSTPVTPAWGKVEGAKVITGMTQAILSGKATVDQATQQACTDMNKALGSS